VTPLLQLNQIETLGFGAVVLFFGYAVLRLLPWVARFNIPAAVIGGMTVALVLLAGRSWGVELVRFDTALQTPLMIAFFTSVGFAASLQLLRRGGPQVVLFLVLSFGVAVLQNVTGAGVALALGEHPLFGVLCGSVTLTGGPATGLAFAPQFEKAGVQGAETLAVAAAMVGIVAGGLMGGPLGTLLIVRNRLRAPRTPPEHTEPPTPAAVLEGQLPGPAEAAPPGESPRTFSLLKGVGIILVTMWVGAWLSRGFESLGLILPAYIGAMMVAAAVRNLDDLTGWIGLSQEALDDIGNVALSFFLVLALMTLELWKLSGAALPLLVVLAAQVLLIAVVCVWPVFPVMGKDYEAAVMSGGFCGFMLGTTANSMANMGAIADRYGPAPRAFLVVPLVGAFFIDFANALLITGFLNVFSGWGGAQS
jgi:ESS family glutamate:Na+ symporter